MALYRGEGLGQSPVLADLVRAAFAVNTLAPGVATKEPDPQDYCFLNLTVWGQNSWIEPVKKENKNKHDLVST